MSKNDVDFVKNLLHLDGFMLTQCGRLPQTKKIRVIKINPKEFEKSFGKPVKKDNELCYIFKHRTKVSHLKVLPANSKEVDYWSRNSLEAARVQSSSFKIINEFITYLKDQHVSVDE
jgi:hypothetical protein